MRSLCLRECGLYEVSDLLLGHHLMEKSEAVQWVKVGMPHCSVLDTNEGPLALLYWHKNCSWTSIHRILYTEENLTKSNSVRMRGME